MNLDLKDKKIRKGYIIPAVIAVIFTIAALLFFTVGIKNVPFSGNYTQLSVIDSSEIIERTDITPADTVSRSALGAIEKNTQLGIISFGNTPMSVIYAPYESVEVDCIALQPKHSLIGETGVCLCTITKNNSALIADMEEGDTLKATTVYSASEYTLTAVATGTFPTPEEAAKFANEVDADVVFAADVSEGVTIEESYRAVAFEVSGGAKVVA